ncbi:MAG: DUF4215 domain-containing protein [Nannocystaceae bacterium]
MRHLAVVLSCASLVGACSFTSVGLGETGSAGASTGSEATGDGATSAATETTAVETTGGPGTAGGSDSMTGGLPGCGDGVVDAGEACDDGADNGEGMACKGDCTLNVCGDGDNGPEESCDDGNLVDGDGCSAACVEEECGNGIVDVDEGCDDGNAVDDDGCTNACALPSCGDGIVQGGAGEACDDGAENGAGKACKGDCSLNVCGDGDLGPGEGCDDGNTANNDGCSAQCIGESCGDGKVQDGEACDDGNDVNTDMCTNACQEAACGDGFEQPGEGCDDGNDVNTDMCTNACEEASCGDGFVQPGEGCDDGNDDDGDACSNSCEPGGLRVFVTKATFNGNLGGIAGADAKCTTAATAADLGGAWRAWLSANEDANSPSARFDGPKDQAFYRVDNVKIADDWADLTDGSLDAPIDRDEFGETLGGTARVWSNVDPDASNEGTVDCNTWSSNASWRSGNIGSRNLGDSRWTSDGSRNCDSGRRLYCFEQ